MPTYQYSVINGSTESLELSFLLRGDQQQEDNRYDS